jgi:hypothetical protein
MERGAFDVVVQLSVCFCFCHACVVRLSSDQNLYPWLQSYVKLRRDQYELLSVRLTSTPSTRLKRGSSEILLRGARLPLPAPPGRRGSAIAVGMQLMFENIKSHFEAPSNAHAPPRCKIKDDAGSSKQLELCCS